VSFNGGFNPVATGGSNQLFEAQQLAARKQQELLRTYELQQQLESTRFIPSRMGLNFALLHLPPKRLEDSAFQAERGENKTRPAERKKKEREKEKERKEERENIIV
jgi:hypothetical protein